MVYDIGEMVRQQDIVNMIDFINVYGLKAFRASVMQGAFAGPAFAYIHPCDEMEQTEGFKDIQQVFINSYV